MEENMQVTQNQENPGAEAEEVITLSKEEFEKRLQSEADRRVNQALEKKKQQWEKEFREALERERSEAERLARMSEEERLRAEFEKERKKFEEERKQFYKEKLELQTVKELSSLGLPTEFSSFLLGVDAETTHENIKTFQEVWQKAIEQAVQERLKGPIPQAPKGAASQAITPEQFKNMGYKERMELYTKNPDLYNQLKNLSM